MTEAPGRVHRRGGHEVAILLATRGWMLLAGLLTQALLARILAPEGRGVFAACTVFGTVFGVLFALGSDRGAQYQMMSGKQSLSRSTSVGLVINLVASLVAIIIAIPLSRSGLSFFDNTEPRALAIALVLIPVTLGGTLVDLQLAGVRSFGRLGVATILQSAVYLTGLVYLVWFRELGVEGAIVAVVIASALRAAYGAYCLFRNDGLRLTPPTRQDFRDVLTYGIAYYPARIGTQIDLQSGSLFLAAIGTRAEIGFFAAAAALTLRLFMISDSLEVAILPRIASGPGVQAELVGRSLRISGLATGVGAIALAGLAWPIVQLLLSEAFLPAVPLIWILAPGVAVYGAAKPLMSYFRGTDRAAVCSWAIWLGLIVNAAVLLGLYPRLGAAAGAWGMTAGFTVRSAYLALTYRRIAGCTFADTWCPQRADLSWVIAQIRRTR